MDINLTNLYRSTLLKSIKETAEKDITQFKVIKENEYKNEYEKVSNIKSMLLIH